MKEKKIFNYKLAQYLVNKGHEVLRIGVGSYGDKCYIFKNTEELIKDFNTRTSEMRDLRI